MSTAYGSDDKAIETWNKRANDEKAILKIQPTVETVPMVHGRWIIDSDGLPVCSVCDEIAMQKMFCDILHKTWRYDVRLVKTPYCPNCGAKMDGERRADNGMDT
jgi:hypothetical protein